MECFPAIASISSGDHVYVTCARREHNMRRGRGGFTNHKLQLYVQIVYKTQFDDSIRIFRPEKSLREDQLMPMTSIKSKLKCFVKKNKKI